jgi:hypothetical protein
MYNADNRQKFVQYHFYFVYNLIGEINSWLLHLNLFTKHFCHENGGKLPNVGAGGGGGMAAGECVSRPEQGMSSFRAARRLTAWAFLRACDRRESGGRATSFWLQARCVAVPATHRAAAARCTDETAPDETELLGGGEARGGSSPHN